MTAAIACVHAISGRSVDESDCTEGMFAQISLDPNDPVARLHMEDDFPSCTESIPALEQWYTDINEKLARSLDVYKPILEGNFDDTRDEETLCAYSYEEIANAYRLSVRNKDSLTGLKSEIGKADACSDEVMQWQIKTDVTGSTEAETTGTGRKSAQEILKGNLRANLKKKTKALTEAKNRLELTMIDITNAVPTLKYLVMLHYRTCPKTPQQ